MSDTPPDPAEDVWPEEPPRPEGEEDFAVVAIRNGAVQLGGAVITLVFTFIIDNPSADVILLFASMGLAGWAIWWGSRERKWLVAGHGVVVILLDLLTLVSAPL